MDELVAYHVVRRSEHSIGHNRVLLCIQDAARTIEADPLTARFLHLCQGARTIPDHAVNIARLTSTNEGSIRDALSGLVAAGLLRPVTSLNTGNAPTATIELPRSKPIETIGIVTADRPVTFRRGLTDAIGHLQTHGRHARILVVDGSKDAQNRAATRQITERLAGATPITYVGPKETSTIVSQLARGGLSALTLAAGLATGTAGASRSLLLTLSAGGPLLMVDDDMRWTTWRLARQENRLAFEGHSDPLSSAYFQSREEAVAAGQETSIDLLGVHEALLGRDVKSLMSHDPDLTNACSHLLFGLALDSPPVVRVTLAGVAGDAGTYCPYGLLFGRTQDAVARDQAMFSLAMDSREVSRVAMRPVVTHSSQCMAGCMAVANNELLPPFHAIGRNEDGLFGASLAFCDSRAVFGHVPWGIVHDSDRPSERCTGKIVSATETRLADVVVALLGLAGSPVPSIPSVRIRRMALLLLEVADLSPKEFQAFLIQLIVDIRSRQLVHLEGVYKDPTSPAHLRGAVEQFRTQLLRSLDELSFFTPIEFGHLEKLQQRFQATQRTFREFSELLDVWPDVWDQARRWGRSQLLQEGNA